MPTILRLLGRFELVLASGDVVQISGARAQLMLARLALAAGQRVDRGTLSTMLWGERADTQARASLRQLIWTIRQALKPFPEALVADGDLMRLDPAVIPTDAAQFDTLARSSDLPDLEAALALYRGDLLDGIDILSLAPDGYFLQERNRLRDLALKLVTTLVQTYDRDRKWEQSLQASRRGLAIDPYDETFHGYLVGALQKLGRNREARDEDNVFRNRLKSELGIQMEPLARDTSQLAAARVMAAPAPALGPHEPQVTQRPWQVALGVVVALVLIATLLANLWQATGNSAALLPSVTPPNAQTPFPTRNLAAYDQYLRAEALRLAATGDDQLRDVLAAFRAAIALDPDYAAAHAGFALVAVELWHRSLDGPFPSVLARSEAYDAAGRTLQIDPGNARALVVLSRIQAQDGARVVALASARRAVASESGSAEARANLALTLSYAGNATEARAELTQLQRLDPVPRPEWYLIFGQVAFADDRYDAAIANLVAVWPTLPQNALLLEHLAAALALQGRLRQANQIKDRLLTLMPNANLHLIQQRYAFLRDARQNGRLLEGLRRAGLPEWPYAFTPDADLRLVGADLAAVTTGQNWVGHKGSGAAFQMESDAKGGFSYHSAGMKVSGTQVLRDDQLCQTTPLRVAAGEICGSVYRNADGQRPESEFVFVTGDDVRYFSVEK